MNYTYLNGYRIVEDINRTVAGEPYKVKRTWKERLFTWPWNPLRSNNTIIPQVPSNEVIQFEDYLVMHPDIAKVFKESLKNE